MTAPTNSNKRAPRVRGFRVSRRVIAVSLSLILVIEGLTGGFAPAFAAVGSAEGAVASAAEGPSVSVGAGSSPTAGGSVAAAGKLGGSSASKTVSTDAGTDAGDRTSASRPADATTASAKGNASVSDAESSKAPSDDNAGDAGADTAEEAATDAAPTATTLAGSGSEGDPYMATSAEELRDAIAAAPANATAPTYIALKGGTNGVLSLGTAEFTIDNGKNIVLKDAGQIVALTSAITDGGKFLFEINDNANVTVRSAVTAKDSDGNPTVYNFNYTNNKARFARVGQTGSLTIEGGAFENNTVEGYGAVFQNGNNWETGGLLDIKGGLFKGNTATVVGGGVIFSNTLGNDDSQTLIKGGVFDGNVYKWQSDDGNNGNGTEFGGGAIHARRGKLTVSGGIFKNNEYTSIDANKNGTPDLEENVNVTKGGGGAIFVTKTVGGGGGSESRFELIDHKEGGRIVAPQFIGNKSTAPGGAIMISYNASASFQAGYFKDNYAKDMGGAIYTEENTISDFGYTVAYDNVAAHFGGGLWLCPSGVSVSSRESNIALFDNVAGGTYTAADGSTQSAFELDMNRLAHRYNSDDGVDGGAGDDLAIMYPNKDNVSSNSVSITDTWFAGGKGAVSWYWDGQSTVRATGFGQLGNEGAGHWRPSWPGHEVVFTSREAFSVTEKPRFTTTSESEKVTPGVYQQLRKAEDYPDPKWKERGGFAFKTQVSNETKAAVKREAALTFVDNMSGTSGGAIGSNGNLRFTSSGVAAWSKVDANDTTKKLKGSRWKLTWAAPSDTATPYADKAADNTFWDGAAADATVDASKLRWHRESAGSNTWVAIVEDDSGAKDYKGYDTDPNGGSISIENLSEGTYTMTEETAPAGYATSDATYRFTVDLGSAESAIALPQILVDGGGDVAGNAIGNTPLPSIPDIVLTAKKTLVGGTLVANQFSFKLAEQSKDGSSYKYEDKQTKSNDADGTVTFDKLTYTKPGDYVYRVSEAEGSEANVVYDTTAYYVKVHVEWGHKDSSGNVSTDADDAANLVASVKYYSDEACVDELKGPNSAGFVPEFTNNATTSFSFTKVDGSDESAQPLAGASFKLFRRTGTNLGADDSTLVDISKDAADLARAGWTQQGNKITTDGANGGVVTFDKLAAGTYQLVETKAPADYQLPAGQWRIVVKEVTGADGRKTLEVEAPVAIKSADGAMPPAFKSGLEGNKVNATYTLPNYKGFTLPVSGAQGAGLSAVLGAVLIVGSLGALAYLRRRGGDAA